MLIPLFLILIKETDEDQSLLQSYTFLVAFFSHIIPTLDKDLVSQLSKLSRDDTKGFSHQNLRVIGCILLSHNMPRSSSFFFYRPKKEAKKIKFFTYFECCNKLASLKVSRRKVNLSNELRRLVVIFSSLKEFKFAEDYLSIVGDILKELTSLIKVFIDGGEALRGFDASSHLLQIQRNIQMISQCADCHLSTDKLSRDACLVYQKFLCIIYKYLECYQTLDEYSIRKIRQSLAEFLAPKSPIFSSELYFIFQAKRLLVYIDSMI